VLEHACKDVLCKVDLRRGNLALEEYASAVEPLAIELQVACEYLLQEVEQQGLDLADLEQARLASCGSQ